jgi:hypothetical protein
MAGALHSGRIFGKWGDRFAAIARCRAVISRHDNWSCPMNRLILAATAAVMAIGVVVPAVAAINVRQVDQRRSIDAGVRSGKLTAHEAAKLRQEQNLITRAKERMKARHGGHLTAMDNKRIHDMQDAAARHMGHLKYNRHRGTKHIL